MADILDKAKYHHFHLRSGRLAFTLATLEVDKEWRQAIPSAFIAAIALGAPDDQVTKKVGRYISLTRLSSFLRSRGIGGVPNGRKGVERFIKVFGDETDFKMWMKALRNREFEGSPLIRLIIDSFDIDPISWDDYLTGRYNGRLS